MTDQPLADALAAKQLTVDDLASAANVNAAQAEKWLDGRTVPGRRAKLTIAKLVEQPSRKLWPEDHDPNDEVSTRAEYDKVIGVPEETCVQLLVEADHHVDMLGGGFGWWLEKVPTFKQHVMEKQAQGSGIEVRICQADPYGPYVQARDAQEAQRTTLTEGSLGGGVETAASMWLDALDGLDNAELRVSEHAFELAIYRFDDWLVVSPYLAGQRGLLTYADLVHRDDYGGKFDQLINGHFEPVWQEAHSAIRR